MSSKLHRRFALRGRQMRALCKSINFVDSVAEPRKSNRLWTTRLVTKLSGQNIPSGAKSCTITLHLYVDIYT